MPIIRKIKGTIYELRHIETNKSRAKEIQQEYWNLGHFAQVRKRKIKGKNYYTIHVKERNF